MAVLLAATLSASFRYPADLLGEEPATYHPLPPELLQPVEVATPEASVAPTVAFSAPPTPEPTERATPRPTKAPRATQPPKPVIRSATRVSGVATWYCKPGRSRCTRGFPADGAYGAAGPELRAALGDWRGRTVYVNGVAVKLIDWCACGGDHVIDVYHATWVTIPDQDHVTIRW